MRLGEIRRRCYREHAGGPGSRVIERYRGKSGLHETRVAGNARRVAVKPAIKGKCHREQTADRPNLRMRGEARVKGCGKSAPGDGQPDPHGKPHPEQGRIGAARLCVSGARAGGFHASRPGWLLEPCGNARPRGMAALAGLVRKDTARKTEPGLQAPRQLGRRGDHRWRPFDVGWQTASADPISPVARAPTQLASTQTASIRPSKRLGRHFYERGIPSRE